jgi:HAD superfamily hydrolase (TIGR01509 family)
MNPVTTPGGDSGAIRAKTMSDGESTISLLHPRRRKKSRLPTCCRMFPVQTIAPLALTLTFNPMTTKDIQYLLFDHDGVLVDTEYWYFRATQIALAELGVDMPLEHYRQHLVDGSPSFDLARDAGCSAQEINAARDKRNIYYQQFLAVEAIDIEGVPELLSALKQHYRMAIVTTSKRVDFEFIHQHRDIVQHMDFVITREDYDQAKPDPEPYLTALYRFGAKRHQALVIEDSERGLRAAVAAKISCAVVANSFTAHQELSAADYRIASLNELTALLDRH